jgi:hypothetical protein
MLDLSEEEEEGSLSLSLSCAFVLIDSIRHSDRVKSHKKVVHISIYLRISEEEEEVQQMER